MSAEESCKRHLLQKRRRSRERRKLLNSMQQSVRCRFFPKSLYDRVSLKTFSDSVFNPLFTPASPRTSRGKRESERRVEWLPVALTFVHFDSIDFGGRPVLKRGRRRALLFFLFFVSLIGPSIPNVSVLFCEGSFRIAQKLVNVAEESLSVCPPFA